MTPVETADGERTNLQGTSPPAAGSPGSPAARQQARQAILDLTTSVYACSALCSALQLGILEELSMPQTPGQIADRTGADEALVKSLLDVAVELGLAETAGNGYVCSPGAVGFASGRAKEFLIGDLRSTMLQSAHLVEQSHHGSVPLGGWEQYSDPELLEAQGMRSAEPVGMLVTRLVPMLEGLEARLRSPGASLLDVGTGVGRLAIEMCRHFPDLRVVGIDPYATPLELARRNVAEAGLEGRIELRPQRVEDLGDDQQFDLAWVPVMFLPPDVAARGLERVHTALRPDGWALAGSMTDDGDGLQPAVLRLMAHLFGSGRLLPDQAADMLRAAGYDNVGVLPPTAGVAIRLILGQRPLVEGAQRSRREHGLRTGG
ncbi:MAG: hypothetical protein JWM17_2761 [Actinobacteria bacterium]|nr:hypothetical protein [Actinomycetota bacterium]